MTLGVAICLFAILMIYCGVKSKNLGRALVGQAVPSTSGSLLG